MFRTIFYFLIISFIILTSCRSVYDVRNHAQILDLTNQAIEFAVSKNGISSDTIITDSIFIWRDSISLHPMLTTGPNDLQWRNWDRESFENFSLRRATSANNIIFKNYSNDIDPVACNLPIAFYSPLLPTLSKDTFFLQSQEVRDADLSPYIYKELSINIFLFTFEKRKLRPAGIIRKSYLPIIKFRGN